MADYLPLRDVELSAWAQNFNAQVQTSGTLLGLTQDEMTALDEMVEAWRTGYSGHVAAQAAAMGARALKDERRRAFKAMIRPLVRRLQVHPAMTDALRAAMRITIPQSQSTLMLDPPLLRPMVMVNAGERLRHRLVFRDEGTPTRRGKPQGVRGCEIWVKLGAAPQGPGEMTLIGEVTRTRYDMEYTEADGGKMAHYMLRWVSTRGHKGPWSVTVGATVGA